MRWTPAKQPYAIISGMDPFADWLFGAGRMQFFGKPGGTGVHIPFLFLPLDDAAAAAFRAVGTAELVIPSFYEAGAPRWGTSIVAFGTVAFFQKMKDDPAGPYATLRDARKLIKLGLPQRRPDVLTPGPVDAPPVPFDPWPADTVVVATIDDGIAFAHDRFTSPGGTRVQYFWRQDGAADPSSTINVGSELWKQTLNHAHPGIDALLADHTTGNIVDEDGLYGLTDAARVGHEAAAWRLAHGTAVLDIAAGAARHEAPENRPIIAVQLPVESTADTSGANLDVYAKLAVDYIIARAALLRTEPLPVAINFSYGKYAASHDGTSVLELALDQVLASQARRVCLVLPSGNGNLERCHAEVSFPHLHSTQDLFWQVQPENATSAHVEIWMPFDGGIRPSPSRLAVTLRPPSCDEESKPLCEKDGSAQQLVNKAGEVLAEIAYRFMPLPIGRGVFTISMQPTIIARQRERYGEAPRRQKDADPDPRRVAPTGIAGRWTIHLANAELRDKQVVHAYIQRDDSVYGYPPKGRQSYFDDENYIRFDPLSGATVVFDQDDPPGSLAPSVVKRRGMINAIATGRNVVVVGGVEAKTLEIASYSAGGPIASGAILPANPLGVDACAVSDDSIEHAGVLTAGSRSGSTVALDGTSAAAPQVTRLVADILAAKGTCVRDDVQRKAVEEEACHHHAPIIHPHEPRFGWGRITSAAPRRPSRYDPDLPL